jgi:hypothetical protein
MVCHASYTCCNFKRDQRHATDAAARVFESVNFSLILIKTDVTCYELAATLVLGF